MQIDPVALEFDVLQLDLAVLVAAGLHGQHLGVSQEPLQRGKHVSYGVTGSLPWAAVHRTTFTRQAANLWGG